MLAAAVLWATTGTVQALAPEGAQPATIGAMRLAISGATLSLAESLTTAAPGEVVLGERLTTSAVLGIGLIFAGQVLLALGRRS